MAGDLKQRTKQFAIRLVRLVAKLPKTTEAQVIGTQLLWSATSVGANYRAARRCRSPAAFRAKLDIVEEEADKSCFWIELLGESGMVDSARLADLLTDANEITAMVVASIKTSKAKQ